MYLSVTWENPNHSLVSVQQIIKKVVLTEIRQGRVEFSLSFTTLPDSVWGTQYNITTTIIDILVFILSNYAHPVFNL